MYKMTILLIEDDRLYAQQTTRDLSDLGYNRVLHAPSDIEAIKISSNEEIDLIIMDVGLIGSNLDGISLAHQLRHNTDKPIIFLSAFSDRTTLERIKEVPLAHYLIKPCSVRQLFVTIDIAMQSPSTQNHPPQNSAQLHNDCPLYARQNHFYVKGTKHNYERVNVTDLRMVVSVRGGVEIITNRGKYILTASMKSFTEQFPHRDLIRINRSTIVHRARISAINDREVFMDFMDEDSPISIGQGYWTEQKNTFIKLKSD